MSIVFVSGCLLLVVMCRQCLSVVVDCRLSSVGSVCQGLFVVGCQASVKCLSVIVCCWLSIVGSVYQ